MGREGARRRGRAIDGGGKDMRKIVTLVVLAVLAASCSTSSSTTTAANTGGGVSASSATGSSMGGTTSAAAYAKEVCGAMVNWVNALKAQQPNIGASSSAEQTKQALVDYFDAVISETDTMVNQLKAAGSPDVTGGAAASQAFVTAMEGLQTAFHQLKDKTDGLDTSNTAQMMSGFTTVMKDFQTQMSAIGTQLQGLQSNSELDAAFTADPSCQQLSKG
jgi:hypothetical protein